MALYLSTAVQSVRRGKEPLSSGVPQDLHMSAGSLDGDKPDAPTIVSATAVPSPRAAQTADGSNGFGTRGASEVPVVYAQPYAVQDPYGHGQYGHASHPGMGRSLRNDLEGGSVRVTQHRTADGRDIVTFATLNPDASMVGGDLTDREAQLVDVYRLSRFIRNITVFNVIMTIIQGIILPYYLILLPFPVCGYYGAKTFNKTLLYIYISYLFLEIIVSVIFMTLFWGQISVAILQILYILLNFFVCRYAARLCALINHFTDEDREFLTTHPYIVAAERTLC